MSTSGRTDAGYPSAGRAWTMVALLYVAYMLSFVDRQIVAYLVRPLRESLDISDFQLSWITGFAFAVFYVVLGIPLGRLADRVSRVGLISVGIALWSAMTVACGLAGNYWQLFLARIGVGVGEASLTPSGISLIADSFPRERRHLPINIFSAGVHGGLGISNILGGAVVTALSTEAAREFLASVGGLQPWQATFIAVGLPGILVAGLFFCLREPARQERYLADTDRVSIRETFGFLFKRFRAYSTVILGSSISALGSYGMYGWVPALFDRKYHWDAATIGTYFGLITLVFGTSGLVLSGAVAGWMGQSGKRAAQVKLLIVSLAATACVAPFLIAIDSPYWTLGCLCIIVFFLGTPIGLAPAAVQAITPNEMRAQMVAVYIAVVGIFGSGTGPSAVAAVTDFVFGSDAAVGKSLALVLTLASALGALILVLGLKTFAQCETAEASRTPQ